MVLSASYLPGGLPAPVPPLPGSLHPRQKDAKDHAVSLCFFHLRSVKTAPALLIESVSVLFQHFYTSFILPS